MSNKNRETIKATNPYLEGRREWNSRYGSYIKQAYVWRVIAFLTSIIAIIAVLGVVYIGSQNKFVPYIVQVDKLGKSVASGLATKASPIDSKVIKYSLAEFITNFKTVYPDPDIQKDYVFKSYRYLASNFPAYTAVSKFYKEHSPFERAKKERVTVTIKSVLQMSKDTWQIDWVEKITNERGITRFQDRYRGLATIEIIPPTTESEILKNPVGLYIKDFTWSKLLK
jgi:type IV secretion system protein VirB5